MIRSETGTRPLLCNIIRRSLTYIQSLSGLDESLANQALDLEINLDDEKNILSLARKHTFFYQKENNFLEPKTKLELKSQVQQNYDNYWKENIQLLPKASSFITYKFNHEREKYLNLIKNNKHIGLRCPAFVYHHINL